MSNKYLPRPVRVPLLSYQLCTHQNPTEEIAPQAYQLVTYEFPESAPASTVNWQSSSEPILLQTLEAASSALWIYNFTVAHTFYESDIQALDADWRAAATDFHNIWLTACKAAKLGTLNVGREDSGRERTQGRPVRKEKA